MIESNPKFQKVDCFIWDYSRISSYIHLSLHIVFTQRKSNPILENCFKYIFVIELMEFWGDWCRCQASTDNKIAQLLLLCLESFHFSLGWPKP